MFGKSVMGLLLAYQHAYQMFYGVASWNITCLLKVLWGCFLDINMPNKSFPNVNAGCFF